MDRYARFLTGAVVSVLNVAVVFGGVLTLVMAELLSTGIRVPSTLDDAAAPAVSWLPVVVVLLVQIGMSTAIAMGATLLFKWRRLELWLVMMAGPVVLWAGMIGLSANPDVGLELAGNSQLIWLVTDGPRELARMSIMLLVPAIIASVFGSSSVRGAHTAESTDGHR